MKLYWKSFTFIVISIAVLGIISPALISANDDMLFIGGVLLLASYPPFVYKYFQREIKSLMGKK